MNRFSTPHDSDSDAFCLHLTRRQAQMTAGFSTDAFENRTSRHPVTVVIPRNNLRDLSKALRDEIAETRLASTRRIATTLRAVVEDALDAYDHQIDLDINADGNADDEPAHDYPTDEQRAEVVDLAERNLRGMEGAIPHGNRTRQRAESTPSRLGDEESRTHPTGPIGSPECRGFAGN